MKTGLFNMSNEDLVVGYRESGNEAYLQELMNKNKGLFNLLAGSYVNSIPNSELEDLVSESYIAMLDAIKDFDPSRGFSFSTLLKTYVRQRLNKIYNTETRKKRFTGSSPVSYESLVEINRDGGQAPTAFTVECEDIRSIEFSEVLASMDLNEKEKVVVNILMQGSSKGEVAKALNVKPATVTYYLRSLAKKFELAGVCI
jgi:RNA polymerase sigma factor (sigma-70 family)